MTATVLQFPDQPKRYASAPESAKLLKAALRKVFPATKFSVRLSRGTGYGNAWVTWTDGPNTRQVEQVIAQFEGDGFDGMQDLQYSKETKLADGRESGLGLVNYQRAISPAFARRLLAQVADYFKTEAPELVESVSAWSGKPVWELKDSNAMVQGEWWTTHMHRASEDATRYTITTED